MITAVHFAFKDAVNKMVNNPDFLITLIVYSNALRSEYFSIKDSPGTT